MTDSQLITSLIAEEFNQGVSLKEAVKSVVGKKLLGTYRIAAMELAKPQQIIFIKNAEDFALCVSKNGDEIILSSEPSLFNDPKIKHKFGHLISIPNNHLLEVNEDCTYSFEKIDRLMTISRNPKAMFDHIFQEEIIESIDSIELVTDYGSKFISDNQVYLSGFNKNKQELMLIEDLIVSGIGTSKIAAEYGAYIMRELKIFNTVRVNYASSITEKCFRDYKYGGFLTVSQSGKGGDLLRALRKAYENHLTCFNIVNIEDSPLTNALDNLIKQEEEQAKLTKKDSPTVLYDASDDEEDSSDNVAANKNIGLY
jgi:glucosamine 6-phosphate synthetase-like amidotransferase/phosphosugar isomerase protein